MCLETIRDNSKSLPIINGIFGYPQLQNRSLPFGKTDLDVVAEESSKLVDLLGIRWEMHQRAKANDFVAAKKSRECVYLDLLVWCLGKSQTYYISQMVVEKW